MVFLLCLKDPINVFVHIIRGLDLYILIGCKEAGTGGTYSRGQVEHRLPSYESLFVIVLDLHINDMYNAIKFTPS
jgi:hypothetical protein